MIETLRIRNLAIVERAELEFGPGLNVITGETGAGKSLVLGALALLAGGRGSAALVREGAEEARVEAVFRTDALPELEAELERRGLSAEDHALVVARSVSRSGRSRAEVAGRLVPVGALAELFAGRLEISSQHESQALRRPEHHAELLDAFGGLQETRAAVARSFAALRSVREERAALLAAADERARRADFLVFQRDEIDAAAVEPGELAALAAERARLVHAERLAGEAAAAAAGLAGDPLAEQAPGAAEQAAAAARRLDSAAELDPSLAPLVERVRAACEELSDVAAELERYAADVESDPARLGAVDERLAQLERLRRKYGENEEAILAFRDALAAELDALEGGEAAVAELDAREKTLCEALAAHAKTLSRGRARAARRLGREATAALGALAMSGAGLAVALEPVAAPEGFPAGPRGAEDVALRFSANPGEPPRPLHRIASGGEISRVLLALKNVLRRADTGMVLVFDEVDAGIGGRVADRVGRGLAELAAHHQVLCITHLPQIAAQADVHLRVAKEAAAGRTRVAVARLDGDGRVEEIARMAGGEAVGDATRRHARELLRAGRGPAPSGRRAPHGEPAR